MMSAYFYVLMVMWGPWTSVFSCWLHEIQSYLHEDARLFNMLHLICYAFLMKKYMFTCGCIDMDVLLFTLNEGHVYPYNY